MSAPQSFLEAMPAIGQRCQRLVHQQPLLLLATAAGVAVGPALLA